jgi:hypothetical protein
MLWKEWAQQPHYRRGFMVSQDTLDNICRFHRDPGYSTVYAFEEEDAKEILESGSSRGLDRYEPLSDRVVIDIDSDDPRDAKARLDAVEGILRDAGYGYKVYFSGGKGYHVVIPHTLIKSHDLPYSHRLFVRDTLGVPCDESLYQHGRLLSLEGRIHPKTKIRKHLITTVEGNLAPIEIVEKPSVAKFNFTDDVGVNGLVRALLNVTGLILQEPNEGLRHSMLWRTAKDLAAAGLSKEAAVSLLMGVNNTWQRKKLPDEVLRAIQQVYES